MIDYTQVFVVDTEQYAGNFERALVAWMTGQVGGCDIGREEAAITDPLLSEHLSSWFQSFIRHIPDEHGCSRPAFIHTTPGWFNDGVGHHWRDTADPDDVKKTYTESVTQYHTAQATRDTERAEREPEEQAALWCKSAERHRQQLREAVAKGPAHAPAYLSVGCAMSRRPPDDVIVWMKSQTETFNNRSCRFSGDKPITVTGFRLITITETSEPI